MDDTTSRPRVRRPLCQATDAHMALLPVVLQDVLHTLKECIHKNSKATVAAEDETMLAYVSAQAARLIDVKVFTPSEWSTKVGLLSPPLRSITRSRCCHDRHFLLRQPLQEREEGALIRCPAPCHPSSIARVTPRPGFRTLVLFGGERVTSAPRAVCAEP